MNNILSNIVIKTLALSFSCLVMGCDQENNLEGAWVAPRSPEYQEIYLSSNEGLSMIEGVGFRSFQYKILRNHRLLKVWNEYSHDTTLFKIDIYSDDVFMLYPKDVFSNDTIKLQRIPGHDSFRESVDLDSLYSEYLLRRERYLKGHSEN